MKNKFHVPKAFLKGAIIASLAATAGYIIAPIEVRFIQTLTSNSTLIGLSYAIGTILFAFFSIWMGRISDRAGRRKLILLGCALGIIYPLLYAFTFNIFQYIGIKPLWALSSVATGPIFLAHIQDSLEGSERKGHLVGLMFSAQSILGAGAQFLGGFLADRYGFRIPYLLMGAVFAIAFFYALFALENREVPNEENVDPVEKGHFLSGVHFIFKHPALIFYFIYNAAVSVNWGIKSILWPLIIFGLAGNNTTTGSIFATMGIAAFFSLMFIGKTVDRQGSQKSATIALFLMGTMGIVMVLIHHLIIFWIAAAIYALGESLWGPSQVVIIAENTPSSRRGEILALDSLFDKVYNTMSPILAGFLLGKFAPQAILALYVALFWVALIAGRTVLNKAAKKEISQPALVPSQ